MYNNSNINIPLDAPGDARNQALARAASRLNKQKINWLKERNIKFSLVYVPLWATEPTAINMRREDATMFKLAFDL